MELCLMIALALSLLATVCLLIKVLLMRKAARELAEGLEERLCGETNTLIGICSRDGAMRLLARGLNGQLRRLREERQRFTQGDRELREAVTAVAHDLRTPLTAMGGYLELLKREPLSQDARRYVERIEERSDALARLSEELFRTWTALESRALAPERLDLRAALEDSLLSFAAAIEQRGIEPDIRLPDEPVFRLLDADAVSRVFSNILSNALKYSDGDLTATMDASGTIRFANRAKGLTGVDAERLFDRYYTVKTGRGGAGLGLFIARQLTHRMGGSIRAQHSGGVLTVELRFSRENGTDGEKTK